MMHDEIWFSNPLLMNDYQEVRFGLSEGTRIVSVLKEDPAVLHILKETANVEMAMQAFSNALQSFDINHLFDVYVFCLSKYDFQHQPDGKLSMWRGYGANGQGAALVFNTSFLKLALDSPYFSEKLNTARQLKGRNKLKPCLGDALIWQTTCLIQIRRCILLASRCFKLRCITPFCRSIRVSQRKKNGELSTCLIATQRG